MKEIKVNLKDNRFCTISIDHIVAFYERLDKDDKEKGCIIKLSGGHTIKTSQNYKSIQDSINLAENN